MKNFLFKKRRKWLLVLLILVLMGTLMIAGMDQYVAFSGSQTIVTYDTVEPAQAILILGAYVKPTGEVSRMLKDRLDYGYELYRQGKAPKIIVSGDHGAPYYNEVLAMCTYLENKGVPSEDIFMDHAGFTTYDSVYRMKAIFEVTDAIIVSQGYHVVRAAYIAKTMEIDTQSIASDTYVYEKMLKYRIREVGARVKAFVMADILMPEPRYLGEIIPITGSGLETRD